MRIICVGGGPAGLYSAILLKQADPANRITVLERNRLDDTFGFGVVFSDATQDNLAEADPQSHAAMQAAVSHWEDIDIHYRGTRITSTGHGFSGLSRRTLLGILAGRARELGVELCFQHEVTDDSAVRGADLVIASDGFNSTIRERHRDRFLPDIDWRPNRFVWLGTSREFAAFTFYFKENEHGLWRVHAYQYEPGRSTFIVETTDEAWRASGLPESDEQATRAFCERLFAEELEGHPLLTNRSIWRRFPTVRNRHWHHGNLVLLGDAAHTAHFSVGSGTKLALEDAIALVRALRTERNLAAALEAYEAERRPAVESLQRAAQVSLEWFEDTERYLRMEPLQFAFTLLTRSLRITHQNLRERDPRFTAEVDRWVAGQAAMQAGVAVEGCPPPMFTPFRLRDLVLPNRIVVSAMCQYRATDGMPNDWHLVHLGSRAVGGAGLVMTEMTNVSATGRISPGCTGMYLDAHVPAWRRIVDFVHHEAGARIGMQLGHAGRKASTRLMWEGDVEPLPSGNWEILGPSALPYFPHSQVPREMTRTDMDQVREEFRAATGRALEAGFDLIELHCAHGYLLASFISPLTNRRTDEFGGSLQNRLRYPLEVFRAMRTVWPPERPMSVRISATDWMPGGITGQDAVDIAQAFHEAGADLIDVSAGQTVPDQRPVYGRLFQTPFSDRIRQETGIATMAVGNISSYADANTIVAAGRADLVALARAHLWDPYWTRHAAHEQGYPLRWPDPYHGMNQYTPRFS